MTTAATREQRLVLAGAVFRMRKLQGLTQAQVSTRGGFADDGEPIIDHTTVSRVERGERQPNTMQLYALAAGLGVNIDEISYVVSTEVAA